MDVLAPLLVIALLALVVWLVSAPLRRGRGTAEVERHDARLADLEAARDAKYREIRDAELDLRTGKLAEADWRAIDRQLRAEAIAILRAIDDLGHPGAAGGDAGDETERPGGEGERRGGAGEPSRGDGERPGGA